jgi:hypothetical protein
VTTPNEQIPQRARAKDAHFDRQADAAALARHDEAGWHAQWSPAGAVESAPAAAHARAAVPSMAGESPASEGPTTPAADLPRVQPVQRAADLSELRIETRFGGVFFLVNVALFLGLYGDFANPRRRGLALPLWDFVALAGEELAGPALRKDPLWALLARLAERNEGEEPGCALSLRRPAALRRWLRRRLPRLRARLSEALGAAAEAISPVLLELPARVWVTPTRIDVTFALAALPVEVRRAGLDRDPGWVPAAGRSVRFHFD